MQHDHSAVTSPTTSISNGLRTSETGLTITPTELRYPRALRDSTQRHGAVETAVRPCCGAVRRVFRETPIRPRDRPGRLGDNSQRRAVDLQDRLPRELEVHGVDRIAAELAAPVPPVAVEKRQKHDDATMGEVGALRDDGSPEKEIDRSSPTMV